jgi:hypothetical protein
MVCWHDLRGSSERAFQRLPHVCPQCPLFCTMEKELGGPSSQAGATVGITRHSSSLVPRSCPPSPDPFSLYLFLPSLLFSLFSSTSHRSIVYHHSCYTRTIARSHIRHLQSTPYCCVPCGQNIRTPSNFSKVSCIRPPVFYSKLAPSPN